MSLINAKAVGGGDGDGKGLAGGSNIPDIYVAYKDIFLSTNHCVY